RRVIAHTSHRVVWIACATQRVSVLELPLNSKIRAERRDEVLFRVTGVRRIPVGRTDRVVVAVRPDTTVVIVFGDNRVGVAVTADRRRIVPTEDVRVQELPRRTEAQQVSLRVVVARVRAVENA